MEVIINLRKMRMKNRAFIFTMDAVLALIPVFIVMATISQISSGSSLVHQGRILGGERIAKDVLATMAARGDIEEVNITKLNATLEKLVPTYYDYSYELEYKGIIIRNVTRGDVSNATDIMVAKRLVLIKFYALLGIVAEVSHGGSPVTEEECPRSGNKPPIYDTYFPIEAGDFAVFDYWIEGRAPDKGVTTWYLVSNMSLSCTDLQGGNWELFMNANEYGAKVQISEDQTQPNHLSEGVINHVYVKIAANPNREGNFYIIKAPQNAIEDLITYENTLKKDFGLVTLRVSQS